MPKRLTYNSSGVSIEANDAMVRRIQRSIKSTQDHRVIDSVNGFAGLFSIGRLGRKYKDAVLVGCSDGVGSKVLLAAKAGKFDTIGIDLVAMNVNDLITCGAMHDDRRFWISERVPFEEILDVLGEAYKNDATAKRQKMTAAQRLKLHKERSAPPMMELHDWMQAQIAEKKIEPNSGMGEALGYLLKHWENLTLFLRKSGAPLD
ncbi:MAG: transposase, partial [Planctomycetes bacterium]|nr:transposase [Planctomycetota bacterium]